MRHKWLSVGAILLAAAVALGAFGAHALADRLDARGLDLWRTAAQYLALGATAITILGVVERLFVDGANRRNSSSLQIAGYLLFSGTLIFSSTVAALALGAPGWLGAVTPLGGLGLIAGLLVFAFAARRQPA